MKLADVKAHAIGAAQGDGWRVIINGKTAWAGLGNRSGLHDYQWTAIREKYEKSGPRFEKKLDALQPGDTVEIQRFVNITRDRGRWVFVKKLTVDGRDVFPEFE